MAELSLLIALVLLILLSGFFSSSETAMMSLNRYRLRHKVREGNRTARLVQRLLERPDRLLGVILIGNTFANILASSLATVLAVRLWGDSGVIVATIALTLIILIFAEVTPKTFAATYPERLTFIVCYPLWLLLKLLYPIVWLANSFANGLLAIFRVNINKKQLTERLNKDELKTIVHESMETDESSDAHATHHKDMLLGVLDLERVTVDDVMLPRKDIFGIDLNQRWEDILKALVNSPHARMPIYYGSIEKVIGIFYLRDGLRLLSRNRLTKQSMIKAAKEPYYIPESTPLHTQLQKFRERKARLALVVDEYGDIMGLVTMEDILEEIVGELDSQIAPAQQYVSPQKDGSFIVKGEVNVRELNKLLDWQLPESGPKTLNGLIMEQLEVIPDAPVGLVIESYFIEVTQIADNQILSARMWAN